MAQEFSQDPEPLWSHTFSSLTTEQEIVELASLNKNIPMMENVITQDQKLTRKDCIQLYIGKGLSGGQI